MAEQVRYRSAGLSLRVPKVDFTALRAQSQGFGTMAQSLSRMSNFFMQQSEQKAKIEGAEYGAETAPTQTQIKDAYTRGEEIELPGNKSTVYGRAARKAALSIVSDEISALASSEIARVGSIFDATVDADGVSGEAAANLAQQLNIDDLTPSSYALKMNEIIAGFGSVLDAESPAIARKFRAEMAIKTHSKYRDYQAKFIKRENKRLENNFRRNHADNYSVSAIADIMKGDFAEEALARLRSDEISKSASFLDGAAVKTFLDNMSKTEETAAKQVVQNGVFNAAGARGIEGMIDDIQNGTLTRLPDSVKFGIKVLREKGKSDFEIAQEIRTARNQILQFKENEDKAAEDLSEEREEQNIALAMQAMVSGDTNVFEARILQIKRTNPEKAAELEEKYIEAGQRRTESDPDVRNKLVSLATNISFGDVAEHFNMLNNKDRKFFTEQAIKYEDDEFKSAVNWMRGELDIPADIQALAKDDDAYKRAQLFSKLKGRLDLALTEARKTQTNFDSLAIAEKLMRESGGELKDALDAQTRKQANSSIENLNTAGRFSIPEDGYTEAIAKVDLLLAMKKNQRPAGLRTLSDGALLNIKKALEKARDL